MFSAAPVTVADGTLYPYINRYRRRKLNNRMCHMNVLGLVPAADVVLVVALVGMVLVVAVVVGFAAVVGSCPHD